MLKRGKKYLREHIKFLEYNKIPFYVDICHKSYVVCSAVGKKYFTDNYMTPEELTLVRQVKKYVENNKIFNNFPKKQPSQLRIKYLCFDKRLFGSKTTDILEVDMDAAYWMTAKRLGIIDEGIFNRGMELSASYHKKARLVPLGTLAKRIKRRYFNGAKYTRSEWIEESADTRHLWDIISAKVDRVMQQCMRALGGEFVFYWTDAVFFRSGAKGLEAAKKIINDRGYGCKMIENAWYEFRDDACYVFSPEKGKKMKDAELKRIDLEWVRQNVDWGKQVAIVNAKLQKAVADISERRTKEDQRRFEETGKPIPERKPMVAKQFIVEEVLTMNADTFSKFVQRSFRVRNFCYSITNDRVWKKERKARKKKKTKPAA